MATINLSAKTLAKEFLKGEQARRKRVEGALHESALLGAEIVANHVNVPGPNGHAPIDTGALKASIHVERFGKDNAVIADAPHAGIIESGARPHWAPIQPLIDWVRRHLGAFGVRRVREPRIGPAISARAQRSKDRAAAKHAEFEAQVNAIAHSIQAKIARDGSPPHWFMRNSLPEMERVLREIVQRRIGDTGAAPAPAE